MTRRLFPPPLKAPLETFFCYAYCADSTLPNRRRLPLSLESILQFIRTLGRGSYGEVAQCEDLKQGGLVAIKRVLNVFNSQVRENAAWCANACGYQV